jgi:thioredoxin reductase (NADPH)
MIVRKDVFRASKIMQEKVLSHPKVTVLWNSQVTEVFGEGKLETIAIHNSQTNTTTSHPADGLFLAIGHKPATEIFKDSIALDEKGYIVTRLGFGEASISLAHENIDTKGLLSYPTMTSVPGVFAGGDVVDFRYRQAITAAGFGTMAALDAEWYLEREESKR